MGMVRRDFGVLGAFRNGFWPVRVCSCCSTLNSRRRKSTCSTSRPNDSPCRRPARAARSCVIRLHGAATARRPLTTSRGSGFTRVRSTTGSLTDLLRHGLRPTRPSSTAALNTLDTYAITTAMVDGASRGVRWRMSPWMSDGLTAAIGGSPRYG